MKRTFLAAAAILFALGGAASAQSPQPPPAQTPAAAKPASAPAADTLRVITDFDSPPFAYREGMKKTGAEIDLAAALAKELGRKVEWAPMKFDVNAYASALNRGIADAAIACISITPERARLVSFTKPYARMGLALAVRSDIDWRHQWFTTGLKGWRIAVLRGTTAEKWARENLDGKVEFHSSLERMIQVLKDSRMPTETGKGGTCILYDEVPLRWSLSKYSYRYEIVERGMETQKYGIAVRKGNTPLLNELNAALEKLKAGKELAAIREKWRTKAEGLDFFKDTEE